VRSEAEVETNEVVFRSYLLKALNTFISVRISLIGTRYFNSNSAQAVEDFDKD
jgi:hypothetical protein